MTSEVWTQGNEMKHEPWSVNWRIWDETWTMKYGLKEIRWNMNNEVDDVTLLIKQPIRNRKRIMQEPCDASVGAYMR